MKSNLFISDFFNRISFWKSADRIGPDILGTHWRLHFKSTMLKLCKEKFKYFDDTAEFRPGAYAIGCSKISIGKRVVIRPGTMLFADTRENDIGIAIQDNVLIGSCVHFYVTKHNFGNPNYPIIDQGFLDSKSVLIKSGCWIGANVTILPGVTIGKNAVIGAGSVVTKTIPDFVVAVGNPAKIISEIKLKQHIE